MTHEYQEFSKDKTDSLEASAGSKLLQTSLFTPQLPIPVGSRPVLSFRHSSAPQRPVPTPARRPPLPSSSGLPRLPRPSAPPQLRRPTAPLQPRRPPLPSSPGSLAPRLLRSSSASSVLASIAPPHLLRDPATGGRRKLPWPAPSSAPRSSGLGGSGPLPLPPATASVSPASSGYRRRRGGSPAPAPSSQPAASALREPEMEEAMANLNLNDFEFFKIMLPEVTTKKLRLPDKFARELEHRELRDAKLQVAGEGRRLWDVKVVVDGDGDAHLGRGWQQFARAHDLQVGHFLVFRFDGTAVFTVTVFDDSMCRRHYQHEDAAGSGSGTATMDIEAPSQFTVTLRQCNLREKQNQYLNVPVEFQDAHGYVSMRRVVLEMGGVSWPVKLKRGRRPGGRGNRTTFRYGWHQFCVDNGLGVGDTCFFRVLREGDGRRGGEDHVLKVEVRKRDGTFLD